VWREIMLLVRASPEGYYDFLGDDVLEAQGQGFAVEHKPLWLNLGYWEKARTYPEACADMARLLADAAQMGPSDRVLDVGFGFGEQDRLWIAENRAASIVGYNVTKLHVDVGRQRAEASGMADRIDLQLGSATELPLDAESVDKVVALECAFHFDTREKFFDEAMRVLKPGGRLACADCIPYLGEHPAGIVQWLGWRRWGIPIANIYDSAVYAEKLAEAGFEDIEVRSIRQHVFPGMHKYAELRREGVSMDDAKVELTEDEITNVLGVDVWAKQGGLTDYVIASARKPA
jgi:microcystin synthetase protein McyJ